MQLESSSTYRLNHLASQAGRAGPCVLDKLTLSQSR